MSDNFADFKDILPDFVESEEDFENYKILHSAEHVFAQAVKELYGDDVTLAVAHISKHTFANDAHWNRKVTEEDFAEIEAKMKEIIKRNLPIRRRELPTQEARELFKDNPYKLEWIDQFAEQEKTLTVYETGDQYVDFCKGPHVNYTKKIKAFKLLNVAGAYWRGDENNEMLVRIYGTAFGSKDELEEYLEMQEEAKKRDHRALGKQLDLFTFSDHVGQGLPLYTPRGASIRLKLNQFVEDIQKKADYQQVWTPQIAKASLFKTSGHYDKYKDDMLRVVSNYSDEEFFLKPMNCPQHTQIFASRMRSYKDLPLRITDFAMLYRDEKPGEMAGLARTRGFSQDDCHIFCSEDQVDTEIDTALQMTKEIMEAFKFDYRYRLSTRDPENPDKYLGDPKTWDKVEKWAIEIMKRNNIDYYDGPGEAAFYAPKMDLMATDALGREWQLSTVQIDYVMPERFDLYYINEKGERKHPVMLHRAIIGSAERMMMILLEHFAGAFPAWLAPEQVRIIPISEENEEYGKKLESELKQAGIHVQIDVSSERMQNKIRKAQEWKVPYMLIVGKQEEENETVSLRLRTGEEFKGMSFAEFREKLKQNISEREIDIALG